MNDSAALRGRVCAITGGSRGIGAELAAWMAAAGADVALCGRNRGAVAGVAARISDRFGVATFAEACDVADADAVDEWVRRIDQRFGRLDIVVANAAVFGPVGPIDHVDMSSWMAAVAVDVGGVAGLAHAAVPLMRRGGFGRLIALSGAGIGGPRPVTRASAYVASKAAVCALVEVLALELAGSDVTVNAIAPGAVPTGFMDAAVEAGADVAGAELYAAAGDRTPADLEGLRSLVSYLVSEQSSWLSGVLLSARWDSVQSLERARTEIESGSRLRLRRIDGDLFMDRPSGAS